MTSSEKKPTDDERDERLSLHGADPEEVLRALLATKPDDDAEDLETPADKD